MPPTCIEAGRAARQAATRSRVALYLRRQADGPWRYLLEQAVIGSLGWIPTPLGMAVRAVAYRLILRMNGWAAIERGVRLRYASHITLDHAAYIDQGVYLHACPNGIRIGKGAMIMHGAVLHVYNFRGIPHSGIWIGDQSLVGEYAVIRGQGGVRIGDRVYLSPMVQIMAVNHVFDDPDRPFIEQGITARGITIEDDVWIGSGAVITDGTTIGRGAVVAAASLVTRNVQPHTVVGGVPATFLRQVGPTPGARIHPVYYGTGS